MENDNYSEECSKNDSWAFTVKRLGVGEVLPKDYAFVISVFQKYGYVDCCFYEKDSNQKLHVHGVVQLRKGFYRKRLCIHGFHVHLIQLYERNGWERYITKDQNLFDPKFEPPSSLCCEDILLPFVGEQIDILS